MITITNIPTPEEIQERHKQWRDQQISQCQHCIDAYGLWIVCNKNGVETERYNLACMNCKERGKSMDYKEAFNVLREERNKIIKVHTTDDKHLSQNKTLQALDLALDVLMEKYDQERKES